MDAWLKPLIFGLCALLAAPFILTELLFVSSGWEGTASRGKRRIRLAAGTVLNLAGNLAAELLAMKALFHIWNPRVVFGSILRLNCSYQDVGSLALMVLAGLFSGLAGGWILRRIFNRDAAGMPGRCRGVAILLAMLCLVFVACGCAVSYNSPMNLYMTEVCRKTKVYLIDPERKEKLGDGGREICYVRVHNPGILKCRPEALYLSDSDENPKAIAFEGVTVQPGRTLTLAVDHVHGLDLDRKNGADVYFSDPAGRLIDQVRVPSLEKDEVYVLSGKDPEKWQVTLLREDREYALSVVPSFSVPGGFYPEAFDLEITAPEGYRVLYTLDGSDPAVRGTACEGPLRIVDRTPEENVWTARQDLSGAFVMPEPLYSVPDGPVDKCTVIRAVCADADGRTGPPVTASYFVGYEGRPGYAGINIVSLTADPEDLFGSEKGIFVLGDTYLKNQNHHETYYWYYPANYHGKGRAWEREATFQFFDTDRTLLLSQLAGIRIKGGRSSGYMPKGLNLYARNSYDGNSRFDADLFGNGYRARHISLAAAINQFKDWLCVRLAQGQGFTMLSYKPCCVFLNGEYWGLYWLTEQYDEYYFAHHYGLSAGNVVIIKAGKLKAGTNSDLQAFNDLKLKFRKADMRQEKNYKNALKKLDVDAIINYYAVEVYITNHDWKPRRNQAYWYTRNPEDSPWGDTRWRPAMFDLNKETVLVKYEGKTINYITKRDLFFRSLLKNPEFSRKFYTRLKYLAEEVFTEERLEEALAEYRALVGDAMDLETRQLNWLEPDPGEVEKFREFIRRRPEYILEQCSLHLDTAEGKE